MDKNIKEYAINIRKNIIEMVTEAKSGHVGGSLSAVEILTYLYFKEMNIAEDNLNSKERDYFVLSKGHAAPVLYATLSEKGFIPKEELMTLNGVGEVKAEAIIVYRQENGAFESIDEMMQISGIGKKTFDKIKQFITTE